MTYFELFGLPASPDLDVKALEQRHRELSLEWHPDRFAGADAKTRVRALEQTTTLNEAFKVLRDPIRRATYLLKLQGIDLETEGPQSRTSMPIEFLEEIMERREDLEGAKTARDLSRARALADSAARDGAQALGLALAALKEGRASDAAAALSRTRYYTRFVEEVDAYEEEQLS